MRIQSQILLMLVGLIPVAAAGNVAALPLGAPGSGHASLSRFIATKGPALAPMGHVVMCAREPSLCEQRGGAATVTAAPRIRFLLKAVNSDVNRDVVQVQDVKGDMEGDVLGDIWRVAVTKGDCEDIALAKRERLIAAGVPPRALRLAVARTPQGEGHAVLVVTTSQGDLVLDNRHDDIRPWAATDLDWIKIQSSDHPRRWHEI
jgi:predicted transglutaminase-like cysteine proteinase